MSMKNALRTILGIAIAGMLFSGYLSYRELIATSSASSCSGVGAPGSMLGAPPCVYGLIMYASVVLFALLGLATHRERQRPVTPCVAE